MRSVYKHIPAILGFLLTVSFGIDGRWSTQEFCWSTWLTGLIYTWALAFTVTLSLILHSGHHKKMLLNRFPITHRIPSTLLSLLIAGVALGGGYVAFRAITFFFGFYGLFLSFFAEMEPHEFFGRNGFINSDFFTPCRYLLNRYWPMVIAILLANWQDLLPRQDLVQKLKIIRMEIIRMHLFVLFFPFVALIAWLILRTGYHPVTILIMSALLVFSPKPGRQSDQQVRRGDLNPEERSS